MRWCPHCGRMADGPACRVCEVRTCGTHASKCRTCGAFACPVHRVGESCADCHRVVSAFRYGLGFTERGAIRAARDAIHQNQFVREFDYRLDGRVDVFDGELLHTHKSGNKTLQLYAYHRSDTSRMVLPMCWTCADCGATVANTSSPCHRCGGFRHAESALYTTATLPQCE